ncbi:hypothetical protein [uncultured Campylobacter sp.]|uniref:hypothetical protein n=1 Tax=uncultured Campylobacter sp. TaxID=218934 RepID=UPI0015AF2040|nr:hypothetical protein [uncultured Campylobacter sp.]
MYTDALENIYQEALNHIANNSLPQLPEEFKTALDDIVMNSEKNKGVMTVLITLLLYKIIHPEQDIRYHQSSLRDSNGVVRGFSGRGIDTKYVTPFLKNKKFPSMSASGWLTRSLEQALPYTLDYKGKISPKIVKEAFLRLVHAAQEGIVESDILLIYIFVSLIRQRESLSIELAKPHNKSINSIVDILKEHFTYSYNCHGGSRLPTLAIYAAYQCIINEVDRYKDKYLCSLESHNSADTQSGRIGDIDINYLENNTPFEGVEIKHEIVIDGQLIYDAYEKFKGYRTNRYYILTTANMEQAQWGEINKEIARISSMHGCQVIVNGVYSSIKYYLRLINDSSDFIDKYVELLKVDDAIKFQHKTAWNEITTMY